MSIQRRHDQIYIKIVETVCIHYLIFISTLYMPKYEEVSVQKSLMNPIVAIQQKKDAESQVQRIIYRMADVRYILYSQEGRIIKGKRGRVRKLFFIDIILDQHPNQLNQSICHCHPYYITFLKCKNSQLIYQLIKDSEVRVLKFYMCELGNLFFNERLNKVYVNLVYLRLSSDSFGNRGLKILMLNYFPKLRQITFSNTNLTSDCIKILNKKYLPQFRSIGIFDQKNFRYDLLLKECKAMMIPQKEYSTVTIGEDFHLQEKNFIYLNNIVKIQQVPHQQLTFYTNRRKTKLFEINMLISAKNLSILRQ